MKLRELRTKYAVESIAPSPSGHHIAVVTSDDRVLLQDVHGQEKVRELAPERRGTGYSSPHFDGSGATLCATRSKPPSIVVWDVQTGATRAELTVPEDPGIYCCAISRCGRFVAIGFYGGRVEIRRVSDGSIKHIRLIRHREPGKGWFNPNISSVDFTSDGSALCFGTEIMIGGRSSGGRDIRRQTGVLSLWKFEGADSGFTRLAEGWVAKVAACDDGHVAAVIIRAYSYMDPGTSKTIEGYSVVKAVRAIHRQLLEIHDPTLGIGESRVGILEIANKEFNRGKSGNTYALGRHSALVETRAGHGDPLANNSVHVVSLPELKVVASYAHKIDLHSWWTRWFPGQRRFVTVMQAQRDAARPSSVLQIWEHQEQ